MDVEKIVDLQRWNAVYLLSALCTIFMSMAVAIQPLFLREVLHIPFDTAGSINANIMVTTEIFDIMVITLFGYLSDRHGRVVMITAGFLVAAIGALLVPFSAEIALLLGIGGLAVYYLFRIVMSLGSAVVWTQLGVLAGDFTNFDDRPKMLAKSAFMMAFGATLVYAVCMQIPRYSGILAFMLFAVIVALSGVYIARTCLQDVITPDVDNEPPWTDGFVVLLESQKMRLAFAAAFFSRSDMVFMGMFMMLWFIYFADLVHIDHAEAVARAGLLIGYAGVVMLVTIPLWGRVIDRIGRVQSLIAGLAISACGFLLMIFVVNPFEWLIVLPVTLIALGQASCLIAPQILVIDLAPAKIRGLMLGGFNLVGGIGVIICVQVGGMAFDSIGPFAPFVFIGLCNLVVIFYALWVIKDWIIERLFLTQASNRN
ncbi:MAG: magnetosome biogenesis transporter MamH [Mariprofundus sp.]|nr:magnetosome biogenesis transporter MamH [Mariprofundus sp.]